MMKRIIIIGVLTFSLLLSACSGVKTEEQLLAVAYGNFDVTEVITVHGNRIVYSALKQLLEPSDWGAGVLEDFSADLVVIGAFTEEAESKPVYEYSERFGKDIIINVVAYNRLLATEVLKGNIKTGETVRITQAYAFDEERGALISFDELTPMNKGDQWIYFLKYSESHDAYYSIGRYPLPDEALKSFADEVISGMNKREEWLADKTKLKEDEEIGKSEQWYVPDKKGDYYRITEEEAKEFDSFFAGVYEAFNKIDASVLGVWERNNFNFMLYAEILEHFQIKARNFVNPGRESDAILIKIFKNQSNDNS